MSDPEQTPKNVIWIFGDQHRSQMLSCNGDPNVCTPNIDRLSASGVQFENAVSGFPLCCPFRGSLLTSRYPNDCVPGHEIRMPEEMPTIAHAFKDQGYHTAYFGKWHLDGFRENIDGRAVKHVIPEERRGGFDTWIGYENNNAQWDCWVHGTGIDTPERLPGYETDELTNLLISFLDNKDHTAKPFFAALSVQPPHNPYLAPAEWMARHNPADIKLRPNVPKIPDIEHQARRDLAGAAAMVENLDWNVGRIIEAVCRNGLADNTYIVFFSDHGDMHGSHGKWRKTSPWEESIRIPFIISSVGSLGTRYNSVIGRVPHVINHVDIAPTTLGLCDIETPSNMCGFDYSNLVKKGKKLEGSPASAFIQNNADKGTGGFSKSWRGVVTPDNWKYICLEHQPLMLHNLDEDPYEQVNLAFEGRHNARRLELQAQLSEWIDKLGDPFALPSD